MVPNKNRMILSLDELTNVHMRLRMHELNTCIVNRDLVRYAFNFFKNLMPLFNVIFTIELKN